MKVIVQVIPILLAGMAISMMLMAVLYRNRRTWRVYRVERPGFESRLKKQPQGVSGIERGARKEDRGR